ncbi:HDOD domain-containing protein [Myxococcota bacterium]|nr:HDOD domain-containing protein [Myxococcota bacterium]MBU1381621.1 HDOD domain-containing protein [Myxococcota bacterium]MBU1496835.1 HDOD domain-containing protein [Myxococcota bacterium]
MFSFFSKAFDPASNLKKVLKGYELPSFPAVVMEILRKLRDPNSSYSQIAASFSLDPGLSVKLLRMANSPAFCPVKRIDNITQAIALVGLSQLESLVISVGIARNIPRKRCNSLNPSDFWLVSAQRAMIADEVAKRICPARESECFTGAFLQDMALPFLACQRVEDYEPILSRWAKDGGNLADIERQSLKWDHAEVASWICDLWQLPENIAAGIRGHHGSEVNGHEILPPVRIAALLRTPDKDGGITDIFDACLLLGINETEVNAIFESALKRASSLAGLIASV